MWKFVMRFYKEILSRALHKSHCRDKSTITSSSACLHQAPLQPELWCLKFGLVRYLILLLMQTSELLSEQAYRVCYELKTPVLSVIRIAYWGSRENIRNSYRITVLKGWNVCVCVLVISVWQESESVRRAANTSCFPSEIYIQIALRATLYCFTLWINFTISHFSILIKKHQLPLKKSILLRKTRIPGRFAVPGLYSKTWRCFWAFLCQHVWCSIKHLSLEGSWWA